MERPYILELRLFTPGNLNVDGAFEFIEAIAGQQEPFVLDFSK